MTTHILTHATQARSYAFRPSGKTVVVEKQVGPRRLARWVLDREIARTLYADLKKCGFRVW